MVTTIFKLVWWADVSSWSIGLMSGALAAGIVRRGEARALVIGLVPGGERAAAVTIGPIVTLVVAALVFRKSRTLGAWIAEES